jgi:enoyl-CoA hydratase
MSHASTERNEEWILLDKHPEHPHVGVLTLNRIEAGNAFNTPMLEILSDRLDQIEADKSIRVLVIHSNGANASFGADLNELVAKTGDGYGPIDYKTSYKHVLDGRLVAIKLFRLRVPTIGLMHGFTLGGGAEFYTLCDVLYGASGGRKEGGLMYGFPEVTLGCMAGWMGPENLIRVIGPEAAKDLLYSGRLIPADEAHSYGVVHKLFPRDRLLEEGVQWAASVAANAPFAIESTRRTLNRVLAADFEENAFATINETTENLLTQDFVKGASRILEKKKEPAEFTRE